jgi:DNA/RNA-binding domain of Phe-tRNA-synthetase-like protein
VSESSSSADGAEGAASGRAKTVFGAMEVLLRLDRSLTNRVRVAVLSADGIVVRPEDQRVWDEVERVAAAYRARWAGKAPGEIPELQPARELYRRTGEDPTKLRPSSEALLRRILRGEALYRINSLVDTCNLCSIEFLLPIGLYDRDRIRGEVTARLGRAGESYESLGKGLYVVEGRPALFDEEGPFGSPTNDSRRTAITEATTRCLMVIFAPASYAPGRLAAHAEHAADRLRTFASAGTVAQTLNP